MSSRIPPLLEPYINLPAEASLILLTSVLGASSNWLVLRYIYSALLGRDASLEIQSPQEDTKVLLMSFMRDHSFWKESARRLGLDLDKLTVQKKFSFMDGLSGLFSPGQTPGPRVGGKVLPNSTSSLQSVFGEIQQAIKTLDHEGAKIILIIDQLDLLLAAGGDDVTAVDMGRVLMGLRERVHSTILSISADFPLVLTHQTSLETDHAAFLLSTAHQSDFIMGLRLLDSGTARDVSGVLRITVGDRAAQEGLETRIGLDEKELLYFVRGDGGVKVFERGQ